MGNHVLELSREALREDATNRAWRTFLQGLAIDVLVAVAITAYAIVTNPAPVVWGIVAASLVRSVVQAAASYVMRMFVDTKTGIALPPAPVPPPAEPADTPVDAVARPDDETIEH